MVFLQDHLYLLETTYFNVFLILLGISFILIGNRFRKVFFHIFGFLFFNFLIFEILKFFYDFKKNEITNIGKFFYFILCLILSEGFFYFFSSFYHWLTCFFCGFIISDWFIVIYPESIKYINRTIVLILLSTVFCFLFDYFKRFIIIITTSLFGTVLLGTGICYFFKHKHNSLIQIKIFFTLLFSGQKEHYLKGFTSFFELFKRNSFLIFVSLFGIFWQYFLFKDEKKLYENDFKTNTTQVNEAETTSDVINKSNNKENNTETKTNVENIV